MTKKKADMSIRIRRTFSPREASGLMFDALIINAFFKSSERANSWWSVNAAATRTKGGDVLQADAPQFQKGDVWPYSVRVVKRVPADVAAVAHAVRALADVTIKTTELLDGQTGLPREVR